MFALTFSNLCSRGEVCRKYLRACPFWRWLSLLMVAGVVGLLAGGCNHRDLSVEPSGRVRVPVVVEFDWTADTEATPASMSVYFFKEGSSSSLCFDFTGHHGGKISIEPGVYSVICFNSDSGAHDIVSIDSYEDFGLRLFSSRRFNGMSLLPALIAGDEEERVANAPDEMWAASIHRIEIKAVADGESQIVMLAPEPVVHHYQFIIHNPQNFTNSVSVMATVSGMTSTIHPGRRMTGDETVTHIFGMSPRADGSLHGELLTFGHCTAKPLGSRQTDADEGRHNLVIYATLADGQTWYSTHDVTDQIHASQTPDCVVELDSIVLPRPTGGGGFTPTVDEWHTVTIPIGM